MSPPSPRLITEADVLRLEPGAVLEHESDTLITPAARDRAMLRGIRLVARSSRRSDAGRDERSGALPADLADGDYLVQVRDGRVRVRRIEGGTDFSGVSSP